MTNVEFSALFKRWLDDQKRKDIRAGHIAAMIGNCLTENGGWSPEVFFPLLREASAPDEKPQPQTWQQQLNICIAYTAAMTPRTKATPNG